MAFLVKELIRLSSNEPKTKFVRAELLLKSVKKGDMIEIDHKAYCHWALYIGDGSAIHLTISRQPITDSTEMNDFVESNVSRNIFKMRHLKPKNCTKGVVKMEQLVDIAKTYKCRVNNKDLQALKWALNKKQEFRRFTADEVVKRARLMVSEAFGNYYYEYKESNCEHFATYWKYNTCDSDQVNKAMKLVYESVSFPRNVAETVSESMMAALKLALFYIRFALYLESLRKNRIIQISTRVFSDQSESLVTKRILQNWFIKHGLIPISLLSIGQSQHFGNKPHKNTDSYANKAVANEHNNDDNKDINAVDYKKDNSVKHAIEDNKVIKAIDKNEDNNHGINNKDKEDNDDCDGYGCSEGSNDNDDSDSSDDNDEVEENNNDDNIRHTTSKKYLHFANILQTNEKNNLENIKLQQILRNKLRLQKLKNINNEMVNGSPETIDNLSQADKSNTSENNIQTEPIDICISVTALTGRVIPLTVKSSDTIETIKAKIWNDYGVKPGQLRLIFGGKQLKDEHTLSDYTIKNGTNINLVLRLHGGCSAQKFHLIDDETV